MDGIKIGLQPSICMQMAGHVTGLCWSQTHMHSALQPCVQQRGHSKIIATREEMQQQAA
jgi:hypothetical protein